MRCVVVIYRGFQEPVMHLHSLRKLTCVHWLTSGRETMVTPAFLVVSRILSSSLGGWAARELHKIRLAAMSLGVSINVKALFRKLVVMITGCGSGKTSCRSTVRQTGNCRHAWGHVTANAFSLRKTTSSGHKQLGPGSWTPWLSQIHEAVLWLLHCHSHRHESLQPAMLLGLEGPVWALSGRTYWMTTAGSYCNVYAFLCNWLSPSCCAHIRTILDSLRPCENNLNCWQSRPT